MARITKQAQIDALRTENQQLRALLADAIREGKAWEADARRARHALVSRAPNTARAAAADIGALAQAYCAAHGVKSCTKAQALSMREVEA